MPVRNGRTVVRWPDDSASSQRDALLFEDMALLGDMARFSWSPAALPVGAMPHRSELLGASVTMAAI